MTVQRDIRGLQDRVARMERSGVATSAPPGDPGPGVVFTFTQTTAATTWTVTHNLGRNPSVTVIVGGEQVDADINYITTNVLTVVFSVAVTGSALLN